MRLAGQVAVVTGGSSGIGRATAVRFAREGAAVLVADLAEQEGASVLSELEAAGADGLFVRTDVRVSADVQAMANAALERWGRIDILVNGAGVIEPYCGLLGLTDEQIELTLDVNLKGTIFCCRAVLPMMVSAGYGCIVNISSSAALYWPAKYPAYTASKMGVLGLTYCLAREMGEKGISVKAIRPVYVDTSMGRQAFLEQEGRPPLNEDVHRMLKPEEIAGIILNMVDPETLAASGTVVDTLVVRARRAVPKPR